MAGIRGKNTKPELVVRRCLTAAGARYRLHKRELPGVPDIVMCGKRIVIFVHGCFWHQHQGCRYAKLPASNVQFWRTKLERNVERDRDTVAALLKMEWRVLTVWECATRREHEIKLGQLITYWVDGTEQHSEIPDCVGEMAMPNMTRLRTIDLFCGGGGSSWGAKAAGAEVVCGVDAWPLATQTYKTNFPDSIAIDVWLEEDSDPSILGDVGDIDLILASPECTNHTCAKGNRPRDENSKQTARYVINFARDLTPRWIVLENVVHMRNWHGYAPLITDLENLGYNVLPQILNSADFGVPQSRRRLFLLCDREVEPVPVLPEGQSSGTVARNILMGDGGWRSKPLYSPKRAADTLARAERAMSTLGRGVPFLIVYYGSDGSGGWQPLDRPIRTLTTLDRFGLVTWNDDVPMLRMLQVPELQRAMGFGSDFKLPHGTRRDRIKLLGNGVCPPVMKAVVRSLTRRQSWALAAE